MFAHITGAEAPIISLSVAWAFLIGMGTGLLVSLIAKKIRRQA